MFVPAAVLLYHSIPLHNPTLHIKDVTSPHFDFDDLLHPQLP